MAVYDGTRGAFWNGVRLWEIVEPPLPWSESVDAPHQGALKTWGGEKTASPNWRREITVDAVVDPVTTADVADLEAESHMTILLAQLEDALIARSNVFAALAYAQAIEAAADITNGPYAAGGSVTHAAPGNGWVPAAGDYVYLRRPDTEVGFLASIASVTNPTTVVLGAAAGNDWQTVTSDWVMVYIQLAAVGVRFKRLQPGSRPGRGADKAYRSGISYLFSVHSPWLTATKHAVPRGNV